MSTTFIDFAKVKEATTFHQCIQMLGLTMKQSGGQFRSVCPVHGGGDRTLVVTPLKGFFCFAEKKGGDQIQLVAHVRQCSPREAAEAIVKYFGQPGATAPAKAEPAAQAQPPQATGLAAVAAYLQPAHETVAALGISEATATALGIGFAPRGTMRGRVLIPCHTRTGELVAYCGVATDEKMQPRFQFPSNFAPETVLWNAHRLTDGDLFVCRDILQAVTAYEAGVENVAAFLTEHIKAIQLEHLASIMDEKRIEYVELY